MEYHSITTLNEIRAAGPCEDGWKKLLATLGKTKADDEPISLLTILNSNGLGDALWVLRVPSFDRLSRHFQAWCAEQVLHHFEAERPGDGRVRAQIEMLRDDNATDNERGAAQAAAQAAARGAAWAAAQAAARAAAWGAAQAAARAAAWGVAQGAAQAAAWGAAWAADSAAAWDAARGAQERQLRTMIEVKP